MNKGLWIARKNYLLSLIRKVSELTGGDDIDFLNHHCKEVLQMCEGEKIEEAILCYEDILTQF